MNRISIDAHMGPDTVIKGGHRPGIVCFDDVVIYMDGPLYHQDTTLLENLRDECQKQIWEIEKKRAEAAREPLPSIPFPPPEGHEVLNWNAPAEVLAAPYLMPSAAPPLEGQPLYDPPPDAATCPRCGGLDGTHTTRGCGEPIVLGPSDIVRIAQEAGDDTPF